MRRRHNLRCCLGSTPKYPATMSSKWVSDSTAEPCWKFFLYAPVRLPGNLLLVNLLKTGFQENTSCTWKNFALYLISSVCDEPTAGFNQCGLWNPSVHLSANLGYKAWSAHSRSPTGDIADKGRLDIPPRPGMSIVADTSNGCAPTAGQGTLLLLIRVTECSVISLKAMHVSVI